MPMDISELKSKKIVELNQIAKDLNIVGYTELRKQDLIFKILEAQTQKDGLGFSKGVLEVLPDGYGFDLLPDLKQDASVVFVTSADEYAVHAFDCEAVDYLLKPVSPERLQKALTRVRQRLAAQPTAAARSSQPGDSFLVKTLTEKRLVKVSEIERIVAYGEYSWVYWQNNKKGALLRKSLRQWVKELPGEQFIRVHRRAIVNLACMERIEKLPNRRMQIHLRGSAEPILVSLRLAPILNRKLKSLRG